MQHSCKTQLFVTINDIAKAMDEKLQVDTAVLDFSKAFDKVAHYRLLYKLDYYAEKIYKLDWSPFFLTVPNKLWWMVLNHLHVWSHQVFLKGLCLTLYCSYNLYK